MVYKKRNKQENKEIIIISKHCENVVHNCLVCLTLNVLHRVNTSLTKTNILDSYNNEDDFQKQKCYFEKQLRFAVEEGLTVVLHYRGDDVLHFKMLESLTQICSNNQSIHWHCFT
jgi:hypothetical protein